MSEFTKVLSLPQIDEKLSKMRIDYKNNGIPTILDESLNMLLTQILIKQPQNILEIGTATGCSGIAMLKLCSANLTTVEIDEKSFETAKLNFAKFNLSSRVNQILGDSLELLQGIKDEFDFVFMDGSKSKYIDCLNEIEDKMQKGAVLFSDNVLFRGYIDGSVKCPHRFNTIKRKMREYLDYICNSGKYYTTVLDIGDGIAISIKK